MGRDGFGDLVARTAETIAGIHHSPRSFRFFGLLPSRLLGSDAALTERLLEREIAKHELPSLSVAQSHDRSARYLGQPDV